MDLIEPPRMRLLRKLEGYFPPSLAEKWDNVGVLIDSSDWNEEYTMLLTNDLTEAVVKEAIDLKCKVIVTYHPRPFFELKKITNTEPTGRIILATIRADILVYCIHTSCDNSQHGVNFHLANGLVMNTDEVSPIEYISPIKDESGEVLGGRGRQFRFEKTITLAEVVRRVKMLLRLKHVSVAIPEFKCLDEDEDERRTLREVMELISVSTVAVQAGSGQSVLSKSSAKCWVTGEMSHHDILAAKAKGISVILTGHSNSERFYLERLQYALSSVLPAAHVMISEVDSDPLEIV